MPVFLRGLGQLLAVVVLVLHPAGTLGAQCPVPDITHGQLKPAQNFTEGSTATLQCDAGYVPVGGSTTLRCQGNGRWYPRVPACTLAEVKTLLEIEKLFLEIKKLKLELENLNNPAWCLCPEGSLDKPSHAPGMLVGAGEGAREWGPHLRRSSPTPGDCGPPPRMTHSRPSSDEHASSFPVGSRVTYTCIKGTVKIPERSDTVECLPGARWSKLPEPCSRSCAAPTRLRFAALTKEDERINFFPVGTNVSYVCRPGYENTSESSLTSTCLENLAWSEVAELCRSEYLLGRAAVEFGAGQVAEVQPGL
ncbi:hypothetical protein llap_17446 [Limosa lapponica baueri]|uniref:Sushi domain-containing protein n=1 Tax=Limosa lapponica baueri TaxID=1758121 RepID=A0A2I0TEM8_LIMLA|nr:hypothetical protein llap_17446 [Limosa lapponica baueri]